jgi:hypothetical protein
MSGSEPRSHHHVSEFYLAGFTAQGSKQEFLEVVGLGKGNAGKQWRATPRKLARERDLNRVDDIPGLDPQAFEKGFARFESEAAVVLREVTSARSMPTGRARDVLLSFVAFNSARQPALRERLRAGFKRSSDHLEQLFGNQDLRVLVSRARTDGEILPPNPTRDDLAPYIKRRIEEQVFPGGWEMKLVLGLHSGALTGFGLYHWVVIVAPEGSDFVVSDAPVSLHHSRPGSPSGLIDQHGEVAMPLTRRLALIGSGVGLGKPPDSWMADTGMVREVNRRTIMDAVRFVASPAPEIQWCLNDGRDGDLSTLRDFAKTKRLSAGTGHVP